MTRQTPLTVEEIATIEATKRDVGWKPGDLISHRTVTLRDNIFERLCAAARAHITRQKRNADFYARLHAGDPDGAVLRATRESQYGPGPTPGDHESQSDYARKTQLINEASVTPADPICWCGKPKSDHVGETVHTFSPAGEAERGELVKLYYSGHHDKAFDQAIDALAASQAEIERDNNEIAALRADLAEREHRLDDCRLALASEMKEREALRSEVERWKRATQNLEQEKIETRREVERLTTECTQTIRTQARAMKALREALEKIAMSDRFLGELQEPHAAGIARAALSPAPREDG